MMFAATHDRNGSEGYVVKLQVWSSVVARHMHPWLAIAFSISEAASL